MTSCAVAPVPQQVARARSRSNSSSACCSEEREAVADQLELVRVELLLLHEHLLAHADLAEVVQQPRVAQLAQLLAREA